MSDIPFKHKMAAHCESGTVTALLNHAGLEISEPMVFGIASGIFFGYFKSPNFTFPTIILRNRPGQMRKNIAKRVGVKFKTAKFRTPLEGEKELDRLLDNNIPVAVQVDFFFMDYLPSWQRVHINVHFIIIIGKKGTKYIISDCYYPQITEIESETLQKARFARGFMAPKGFLFYTEAVPEDINLQSAITKGIKKAAFNMVKLPIPFIGVKGIQRFAKKVIKWSEYARDTEHLSHEIMKISILLEDQGTGGAGFRFIYATFLQQAAEILNNPGLQEMSKRMMEIGDKWREISIFAARIGKNRDLGQNRLKELSNMIMERAVDEKIFFNDLLKMVK